MERVQHSKSIFHGAAMHYKEPSGTEKPVQGYKADIFEHHGAQGA